MAVMITSEDDNKIDRLLHLQKGDHVYTLEMEHNGETGTNNIKILDLSFEKYETIKKSQIETIEIDKDFIPAVLYDERWPDLKIEHQDLSRGWFLTPLSAIRASIEAFEQLLIDLKNKEQEIITNE